MVTDRLEEMRKINASQPGHSNYDLEDGRFKTENDALLGESDYMENFLVRTTALRESMSQLNDLLKRLKQIHSDLLLAPGADPEKTRELSETVESYISQLRSLKSELKQLETELASKEKEGDSGLGPSTIRVLQNQVVDSVRALHHLTIQFQAQQSDFTDKSRKKFTDALKVRGIQLDDEDIEDVIRHGDLSEVTKGLMLASKEKAELFEDVKSRYDEVIILERNVRELAEIFVDLNHLVTHQGEMLDRISYNVETAREYAVNAHKNVEAAKKLQASTRKKKIIIFIMIVVLIIILFIFLQGLVCHFTPIC